MRLDDAREARLKKFAEDLSMDYENDNKVDAMLYTIDKALGEAYEHLSGVLACTNVENGRNMGARLMLELFDKSGTTLSEEKAMQLVENLLSKKFGYYVKNGITSALQELGFSNAVSRSLQNGWCIFSSNNNFSREQMVLFCKIMNDYVPPFIPFKYSGNGHTCASWDAKGFRFDEFDKLNVPFYFLDEMFS